MRQYLDTLKEILEKGVDRPNRTGIDSRALFVKPLRFDLTQGLFPAVTTKRLAFNQVKAELLWFIKGSRDVKDLRALGCHIWDENADAPYWKPKATFEGDVGRVYGVQWRKWQKPILDGENLVLKPHDQLADLIARLKKDPNDRRLIVTAWNPGELDQMALPPCHMFFQCFVANNMLSLCMYQRSCDMFLGVPFNIASYALLTRMLAQVAGLKPGELILILADAHIYHNHFDQVREQLTREHYSLPTLWLNPEVKDIDSFLMDDIRLENYQYHPAIKAPMAV